ncbi:MAG TPA: hypothetical protein VII74_04875, partial [Chthoniobacterales bacterium]
TRETFVFAEQYDCAGAVGGDEMKKIFLILASLGAAGTLFGQSPTPSPNDIESLRQQVQALTTTVKTLQQQVKDQQDALAKINAGSAPPLPTNASPAPAASPAASAPPLFPTTDESVVASAAEPSPLPANASGPAAAPVNQQFPTSDTSVVASSPTISSSGAGASLVAPMTIAGSRASGTYMNLSFDGQFALAYSSDKNLNQLEVGDHDPQQRGFNARNLELALDGAVDPYFEGFANIVLKLDNDDETTIEVEEAFLQTTDLPFGLQLKGGQFFAAFGRINPTHPHTWDFVDDPLVHGEFLGPDGLRGIGAQVSWTVPVSWYSQFLFGVQNGRGDTGFSFRNPGDNGTFFGRLTTDREARGLQDFVYLPRWENSFDLSSTQTVLGGISGAFGSNETGADARTQIYGADLLYKWKSPRAEGGFPFVKWQTEAMYRRFEAGRGIDESFPVAETFHDWGMYSQVVWGFRKGWTTGVRGDYLHMQDSDYTDDPDRQSRERFSADLTWYPTEFSKLRLQYNHDFLEEDNFFPARQADSIFFQFEFILGAHGAHKF